MIQAAQMIEDFKKLPVNRVAGAIYYSLCDSEDWEEYSDYKNEFKVVYIYYADKSNLKIHRNGKVFASLHGKIVSKYNLYED